MSKYQKFQKTQRCQKSKVYQMTNDKFEVLLNINTSCAISVDLVRFKTMLNYNQIV